MPRWLLLLPLLVALSTPALPAEPAREGDARAEGATVGLPDRAPPAPDTAGQASRGTERAAPGEPRWEDGLAQMDYFVSYLSLLNLVNGLQLTPEQATRLRALAHEVQAVAGPPQPLDVPLAPELDGVRKTYQELSGVLLRGQPVPADLERRVVEARAAQARFVRATLLPKPVGQDLQCANCHAAPRAAAEVAREPMRVTADIQLQADFAHYLGDYGLRGLQAIVRLSPQVETLLTDAQKALFDKFACCLTPPQDLGDPVRAGQAESLTKELDLLRVARQVPRDQWATAREEILRRLDPVTELVSPGATGERKSATRDGVAKTLDTARGLSDVEFEVEKNDLALRVKNAIQPPPGAQPNKAAYFLLLPGSAKVYTQYLERLAGEREAAPTPP
jgi:hypothetical protein